METSTKFPIALYHLKTIISVRTKRSFEDGFRHYNATEAMIIVNYSTHQLLVLMKISYDGSQAGSFVYTFDRAISSEVERFDGKSHSNYNDRLLPSCIGENVVMSTWSLRHNHVAQLSIAK